MTTLPVIVCRHADHGSPRDEFIYGAVDKRLWRGRAEFAACASRGIRGTSPQMKLITFMLVAARGDFVSKEDMKDALWLTRDDGGPISGSRFVDVLICHIRKHQHLIGIEIERWWGMGYRAIPLRNFQDGRLGVASDQPGASPPHLLTSQNSTRTTQNA